MTPEEPVTAQRYHSPIARSRMAAGHCPECGETPQSHLNDARFWLPRRCDLLPSGVTQRIEQHRVDEAAAGGAR